MHPDFPSKPSLFLQLLKTWGIGLLAGLVATPLAAAAGGAVVFIALWINAEGTTLAMLPGMLVVAMFFGSFVAAPVTLGLLPLAGLLVGGGRRFHWLIWLGLGLVAGSVKLLFFMERPHDDYETLEITLFLAGVVGGLLAGAVFAIAFRLREGLRKSGGVTPPSV